MDYPNTWMSWFTKQLDLELMFTSIISLRTANWNKWAKLFTDILALSVGSAYSLALFIRFGGFTYWIYLLALFIGFIYSIWWLYSLDLSIGFIYWLYLFIGFTYSIWWLYLFAWSMGFSFSVYSIHPHSKLSFSHISERNTFTFLSIYISHVLMEKIFRFPLRHHSGLIKLTLLQLHHHTLLIKLTNTTSLHHIPCTCH